MNTIDLFINSPTTGHTLALNVEIDSAITKLKMLIQQRSIPSLPLEDFRLVSTSGKQLDDCNSIHFYKDHHVIGQYSTLNMLLNLNGGKKRKKKKKIIGKCIKPDHKHVNIPLLPITKKYFEYNSSTGKFYCNRKSCPKCGVGCLMADHPDRYYCGKCHLTMFFKMSNVQN